MTIHSSASLVTEAPQLSSLSAIATCHGASQAPLVSGTHRGAPLLMPAYPVWGV